MLRAALGALRMAGGKVRAFDDAYASKLAQYIGSFNPKTKGMQGVQAAAGAIAIAAVGATRAVAAALLLYNLYCGSMNFPFHTKMICSIAASIMMLLAD